MNARVWMPDGSQGPGALVDVLLPDVTRTPHGLALPGVTVTDLSGPMPVDTPDLRFDHAYGGGWLAPPEQQCQARAFGVVNVAYHLHRGMTRIEDLLGHPLPPITALVGAHPGAAARWSGAHYRLPSDEYSELPEQETVSPTGEIHFAAGSGFLTLGGRRYFRTPAHNPAIIYHELGHHLCRHTADFRLNERRDPLNQGNRKIPLDEGTSDYFAAIMTATPDIFGWQRGDVPLTSPDRRCLDAPWTMAHYRGGSQHDPHVEGTVWSSALWAARVACVKAGIAAELFDAVVLRALDRRGKEDGDLEWNEALRQRRHFSRMLDAMLSADAALGGHCARAIERVFGNRGIYRGWSNRELRDMARARRASSVA